jgi:SAM-dependent methyltransferase
MYIFLFIIFFIIVLTFFYSVIRAIGWVPTRGHDIERFLKNAKIKPGDKMYDLGCGDGRLVFAAAKAGAHATGFEVSLFPYLLAKVGYLFQPNKKNINIRFKDFWWHDLSDADVVYFFLIPRIYKKLKKKLEKELKPGTRVIAYVWPIEGWAPDFVDKPDKQNAMNVYTIK